jgi:hypothetical protein
MWSGRREGADERQMPDGVADSGLDLNDCAGRHIDCHSISECVHNVSGSVTNIALWGFLA